MNEWVTQVGVGGVFLLMVFKMLLDYLKGRNNKNCDNDCVTKGEFEKHREAVRYADTCDKVHEGIQRQFLSINQSLDRIEKFIRNGK